MILNRIFAKFLFSGVINTAAGFGVIYFVQEILGRNPYIANLMGYCTGYVISYCLNRHWTFQFRGDYFKSSAWFILISLAAFLCNVTFLYLALSMRASPLMAQIVGVVAHSITHYFGMRYFAFKPSLST